MAENPTGLTEGAADPEISRTAWLAMNSTGHVPSPSVDGIIITELKAVLFYIASLVPEQDMTGEQLIGDCSSFGVAFMFEYNALRVWIRWTLETEPDASIEYEDTMRAKGSKTILKGFAWVEKNSVNGRFAIGCQTTVFDFNRSDLVRDPGWRSLML